MPHTSCETCGSSDGRFVYPDGHSHCFVCKEHKRGDRPAVVEGGRGADHPFPLPQDRPKADLVDVTVGAIVPRGITEETALHFGAGYADVGGERCQVYPYCDARGRVVAQKLRFKGKRFQITGNAKRMGLFGAHLWRDGGKSVVITEGELDALSFSQAQGNKWPVVSVPNGAQSAADAVRRELEWLERFEKVVLAFDADEEGAKAAAACAPLFSPGKVRIVHWPPGIKDANDLVKAGRSDEIVTAFWGARPWRPDGLVTGQAVWERLVNTDYGCLAAFPHAGLNAKLRGFRPREITVLVAPTGGGKSTTCREWEHALATAGHKVGVIALEESVPRTAMGLLSVAVSRPLHLLDKGELHKPDVRAAFDKLRDQVVYLDHFGSLEDANLLSRIRFMVRGEGCRIVFLDHLSIVVSGADVSNDERKTIDRMMTRLVSLVQETDAHIVAVAHLSRREGTPHEQGRQITLADLRGSHGISQLAHNVVAQERDQQDESRKNITTLRVLKCRHVGDLGLAGYVEYIPETGRQVERLESPAASPFEAVPQEDSTL